MQKAKQNPAVFTTHLLVLWVSIYILYIYVCLALTLRFLSIFGICSFEIAWFIGCIVHDWFSRNPVNLNVLLSFDPQLLQPIASWRPILIILLGAVIHCTRIAKPCNCYANFDWSPQIWSVLFRPVLNSSWVTMWIEHLRGPDHFLLV